MHMYGIVAGNALLIILLTGLCFGCCCNCCCRGPLYRNLMRGRHALKSKAKASRDKKKALKEDAVGGGKAGGGTAGGGEMVAANQPTSSAAVPAERIAELEQHFHDLLQHPLSTKSSKDEAEPIIDFVENKAQISWLTPLIFIFAFVLGSAIVISGSALIGPENILGLTPGRPSAIKALCRSPVHDLIHNAFDANLTAKHTFVGTYLGWTALLEPPTDLCADIEKSEDQLIYDASNLIYSKFLAGESIDFATARQTVRRLPEIDRARRWMISAELPPQGGEFDAPALHMAVQDDRTIGVPKQRVVATVWGYLTGVCPGGSTPSIVSGSTNETNAVGVVSIGLRIDATGCSAGELIVRLETLTTPDGGKTSLVPYNITRYASIFLYSPSSATYSAALRTSSTRAIDNNTDVTVITDIQFSSNLTMREQYTYVNTTFFNYVDDAKSATDNTSTTYTTNFEAVPSNVLLVMLQPPPVNVTIREKFDVVVQASTSHGLAVPGIDVTAMLLAPNGSNALLDGQKRAFTGSDGLATLTLWFKSGRSTRMELRTDAKGVPAPVFDNVYTLLIGSATVAQQLNRKGALTSVVSQKAKEMQTAIAAAASQQVATQLQARMNALRVTLTATIQADVQKSLQTQSQKASDDAAQAASACILASSAAAVTAASDPVQSAAVQANTQACVNKAVQGPINTLQASVTKTVADAVQNAATASGQGAAGSGVDVSTLRAQLQPVVQQAMMTAINQIPGMSTVTSTTGVPNTRAEMLRLAKAVALATWSLLPLPAPATIHLSNGLDDPNAPKAFAYGNPDRSLTYLDNGAYFRAPITGYALSESSEATNVLSGMSSCTLEGYARVEPSPRGLDYTLMVGLLQWPRHILPSWVPEQDEASSYFSSALWQPFPFNNFNFLFDTAAPTADTRDLTGCKKTYMTKGSSFPWMNMDPAFNWTGYDPLAKPPCVGSEKQCLANIPDRSGSWSAFITEGTGDQSRFTPCKHEFTKMFGPDPMPSVRMLQNGGMQTLAEHLECVGCFESFMGKMCPREVLSTSFQPMPGGGQPEDTWGLILDQTTCTAFQEQWRKDTGTTLGMTYESFIAAFVQGMPKALKDQWLNSKPLKRFLKLTADSGWNGCYSERYNRNRSGWVEPTPVRKYYPDVKFDLYRDGAQIGTMAQLIGAGKEGFPHVVIRDKNPKGVWEWVPLRFSQLFMNGGNQWFLAMTTIESGGSRRELELEMLIDGVPVKPINDSWWRFDNVIEYVDPDSVSFGKLDVLFLAGHDAFRVFAVLTIPLFYLNIYGRRRRMPGLLATVSGLVVAWLFVWYAGVILRHGNRTQTPALFKGDVDGSGNELLSFPAVHRLLPMLAFGKNDLVAITGVADATTMQLIAITAAMLLVAIPMCIGLVYLALRWLLGEFLRPAFPKRIAAMRIKLDGALGSRKKRARALPPIVYAPASAATVVPTDEDIDAARVAPSKSSKGASPSQVRPRALANGSAPRDAHGGADGSLRYRRIYQPAIMNGGSEGAIPTRAEASEGFPEEGSWLDADFVNRHRCARNHVRMLLRGSAWYEAQLLKVKTKKAKKVKAPKPEGKRKGFSFFWPRRRGGTVATSAHPAKIVDASGAVGVVPRAEVDVITSGVEGATAVATDEVLPISPPEVRVSFALNRRAPLEGPESFFYPQRLKMACALSLWICLMLTLIFANICQWALAVLSAAGYMDAAMRAQAEYTDQVQIATRFADKPIVMLTALSAMGIQGPLQAAGSTTYTAMVEIITILGMITLILIFVGQWFFIFKNFKSDSFELRRGACFFDKTKFREEFANKYIGFQVAHMSISFIIVTFVYVVVAAVVSPVFLSLVGALGDDRQLWNGLMGTVFGMLLPSAFPGKLGIIIPLIGTLGVQQILNRKLFFVGTAANAWLRLPFWYGLFDYNLLYTNALVGVAVCISRLGMLFVFFLLFIARLDKTTMPGPRGGFINLDAGYKAYIGMLRLDHRYNNPIFLVFGDLMLERLRASRIKAAMRRIRRMCVVQALGASELAPTPEQARRIALKTKLIFWGMRIVECLHDRAFARCVVVRNKWQLAWRLMQQPALRRARADHRLKLQLKHLAESGGGRSASAASALIEADAADAAAETLATAKTRSALPATDAELAARLEAFILAQQRQQGKGGAAQALLSGMADDGKRLLWQALEQAAAAPQRDHAIAPLEPAEPVATSSA